MAETNPKQKFIEKVNAHRAEKVDKMVLEVLKDMFEKDSSFYDIFYIGQRAREIIDEAMEKVSFDSPEVSDARRKFLKKLISDVARKKPKQKRFDGKDETSQRNERCEPIAHAIVDKLIDQELLFSDDYFLITGISEDDHLMLFNLVKGYMDALMDGAEMSLNLSISKANKIMYGCERDEIKMRQLDMILKKK